MATAPDRLSARELEIAGRLRAARDAAKIGIAPVCRATVAASAIEGRIADVRNYL